MRNIMPLFSLNKSMPRSKQFLNSLMRDESFLNMATKIYVRRFSRITELFTA